jgi:hypothetical protein
VNSSVAPNRTELRLLSTPENTTVKQIIFVAPKITLLGTNAEEIKEVDFLPITKRSVDYLRIFNAGKNGSEHYATVNTLQFSLFYYDFILFPMISGFPPKATQQRR